MKRRSLAGIVLCVGLIRSSGACSPNPIRKELPPECDDLATLCHGVRDVSAEAEVCHDEGHRGDLARCLEIHDQCVSLCEGLVAAAGAGGLGGGSP